MVSRKVTAALAAAALFTLGSTLRAQDATPAQQNAIATPRYLADAEPQRKGIMELLNACGAASFLEKNNINIYGYAESSYTYNFNNPPHDVNPGRFFDFESDKALLNQLDLTIERTVDVSKKQFDIGGKVELLFGADASLIHSHGLFDWYDGVRDPENQFDLAQAYLDFAIPVGNGLLVRAGKFSTPLGYETVNPTTAPFYSHSFQFTYAEPVSHTGVYGAYSLNESVSILGGITRGWDQSTQDNNGAIEFLGGVTWKINKTTSLLVNLTVGPERAGNSDDYREAIDFVLTYAPDDKWSFALNSDIGFESGAANDGGDASWYGLAGYAGYKINNYFTLNGRAEWFCDNDGARTGTEVNLFELTAGVTIHPFPSDRWGQYLVLRPELRADFADESVFDGGDDKEQYTAAIDLIYSF